MKKRLYEIIEIGNTKDKASHLYDIFMMFVIICSIIPLAFKEQTTFMEYVDKIAVIIFAIDYILRWITADIKYGNKIGFIKYPFSIMAMLDLLSILPSVSMINSSFRLLKIFRLIRSLRILRIFKVMRYSKNVLIVLNVFKAQKSTLLTIGGLALAYILISALIVLNVEPDTFDTYFDAIYWAVVSLTTVGYGDIYPVTIVGKIVTMISSIFGVAIIALPAGVITAGFMEEINKGKGE